MGGEVMLYKKSILGRKYTRFITGSWGGFIIFVLSGLGLLLFLTLTTRIEVIKTYSAELMLVESEIVLSVKESNISVGTAYIYSNKNEVVYPVLIERIETLREGFALQFNRDGQNIIKSLSTRNIFIDIPQGKETLLHRIFVKGGNGHE